MSFHVFPYREEEPRDGRPPVSRPTVNLTLSNGDDDVTVRALVDTGAPFCIFDRAVADAIGINMDPGAGEDREVKILGDVHPSRMAQVHLELPPWRGVIWEPRCAFLYNELDLSFAGVLGQEGFLDRWVASFNYYGQYFVIEEQDSFTNRLGVDPLEAMRKELDSEWDRPSVI